MVNNGRFNPLKLIALIAKYRHSRNMDVTKHNFKRLLPEIEESINKSSFICIDGEFTGLNAYRGISAFDLPEHRYEKLQESARQFLLIQFGLCTFHYNPETDSYSNQAYNFYVWPRPYSRQAPDTRFLCQTSSLDFLISQDFDFNKLFKDGISYLRPAELEKLRVQVQDRQEYRRNNMTPEQNIPVPTEQQGFLKDICSKLLKFLNSSEPNLELDRANAFQRRLIYQTAREKYPGLSLSGLTRAGGERVISVSRVGEEQQKVLASTQDELELSDLEDAFGFSRVIQTISQSKKLVVGHNMVLDVCHTLNQFCSPLPTTYSDFKDMVSTVLPNIIDTKLMANTIPFKDEIYNSALKELFNTVSEKPYIMPEITERSAGCGYSLGTEKYHEAGYDAFITGLCFISMQRRLMKLCGNKPAGVDADSLEIRPFLNKLYLMKVSDIPYMNLSGEDLFPERNHVFHLEIPKDWKTPDVVHLFSQFGGVNVSWINDSSVFVSLREKTFANTVLQVLQSGTSYTIVSYDGYLSNLKKVKMNGENSSESFSSPTPSSAPGSLSSTGPRRLDLPPHRALHTRRVNLTSGITPTLEKSFRDGVGDKVEVEKKGEKKRSVSPDPNPGFKRSKSIVEDKQFDEPPWD